MFNKLPTILLVSLAAGLLAEIFALAPVTPSAATSAPPPAMFTFAAGAASFSRSMTASLAMLMRRLGRDKTGFGRLSAAANLLELVFRCSDEIRAMSWCRAMLRT